MTTTIAVGGKTKADAPSPVHLQTWHDDWNATLAALSAWKAQADETEYRCTTTTGEDATEAVVDDDLEAWVNKDPGNRDYSVTD